MTWAYTCMVPLYLRLGAPTADWVSKLPTCHLQPQPGAVQ